MAYNVDGLSLIPPINFWYPIFWCNSPLNIKSNLKINMDLKMKNTVKIKTTQNMKTTYIIRESKKKDNHNKQVNLKNEDGPEN